MKPIHQKSLSRILLISFFLQSCGIEVPPIPGHQSEGVGPDGIQQLEATSGGSTAPPLSAEGLQPHSSFVGSHERSAQSLPGPSEAVVQDGPEGVVEEPQTAATELTEVDKLFNAIRDGGTDEINNLLSKDKGLLEVLSERDDEDGRKQEYTLLMYAAHLGSEPMIRLLLSWKPEVNRANKDGLTALHMAAAKGHLAVVKCLKGESAQLDSTSKDGRTPMHLAAFNGHLEVVEYLDKNGATSDVRDSSGLTAFYLASSAGHASVKDYLLQRVIDKRYDDLVKAMDAGKVEEINEVIASLSQLIDKVEKRTEAVKRYVDQLSEDRGPTWCYISEGRAVINKLELVAQEGSYALMLKGAAREFTISESRENRAKLIDILLQLGALHQEQGQALGDLSYYTDAATCYQHVLSICGKQDVATSYALQTNSAYEGLLAIRKALIPTSSVDEIVKIQEEIAEDKQELEGLRVYAQVEADELEALLNQHSTPEQERANEAAYIQRSKELFHNIGERIRAFLARLYRESDQELGPTPCKYTVMGLGSMALQQMTPYSDLEFAILMEGCSDEVGAREYFKRLTHLVNFRIINLGETNMPQNKYGADLDHLVKTGINLDLGGKTPLGRRDKPYTLINTVSGTLHYLKNEGNKVEHIDKNLPYILESTCYVHGDEELYKTYNTQKVKFLSDSMIHKSRAIARMLDGVVEWDYSHPDVVGPKLKKQLGNVEEFQLQFGMEDQGKLYDVKKEIYRLPDRLLYGLALYHGIVPGSGWDAVKQLLERGVICQEAVQHLGYIMSFANMLRLKTYLYYGQQQEGLTMLSDLSQEEAQAALRKILCLPKEALQTNSSLFKYYYTAIPFHCRLEVFFDKQEVMDLSEAPSFLAKDPFYDNSDQVNGNVHRRLLQWEEAKRCYEQALDNKSHSDSAQLAANSTLHNLGAVCNALGEYPKSIDCYSEVLAIKKQAYGVIHPSVASTLDGLGTVYKAVGEYSQSIVCYLEALEIRKKFYGDIHPSVANTLHNLGIVYAALGTYQKSIDYYSEALAMKKRIYGSMHPAVASTLDGLGIIYKDLGKHQESIVYYAEALRIRKQVYSSSHPYVANTLNNLGVVHGVLGKYTQSIAYHREALMIMTQTYGNTHPSVAVALNNLGLVYNALGEHTQSLAYYSQSLTIEKRAYGDIHPDVASTLDGLGTVYKDLGEYSKSISHYSEALTIRERLYGDCHPDVASTLDGLGTVYRVLGAYPQSVRYYSEALAMMKKIYGDVHPAVASTLNNLGIVYSDLKEYQKGIDNYLEALAIKRHFYGDIHPAVARTLNSLGILYNSLGEHPESIRYYSAALTAMKQIYGDNHPSVASTLNNLGLVYSDLKEHQKSIGYYSEALTIRKQFYGDMHPSVAGTLHNLGLVYRDLGDYQESIRYYLEALAIKKRFYGDTHPSVAGTLYNLGGVHRDLKDYPQSVDYYSEALVIRRRVYGDIHPSVASTLDGLGIVYSTSNDYVKSRSCLEEALAIKKQFYGDSHLAVARTSHTLGMVYSHLGEYVKSISHLERALTIVKQIFGDLDPYVAMILDCLGTVHRALGGYSLSIDHLQKGMSYYEQALDVYHRLPAQNTENTYAAPCASIAYNLARMYHIEVRLAMQREQNQTIQEYRKKAQETFELAIVANNPPTASLCTEYANFLLATDQFEEAYQYLRQAITIGEDKSGLSYSMLERETVTPALREKMSQDNPVSLRPIDYAYYLLIHHYEDFRAAGINLEKTREAYLADFQEAVEQRVGQEGQEKEDEIARYLLKSLQQEVAQQLGTVQDA